MKLRFTTRSLVSYSLSIRTIHGHLGRSTRTGMRSTLFRQRLMTGRLVSTFTTTDDFAKHLTAALANFQASDASALKTVAPDLRNYAAAFLRRYQRVDLDGLTPPQDEEYLQIFLRSVFIQQDVRENPPPI